MAKRAITWLHLSDLHFCPSKTGYDALRILKTLTEDVRRVTRQHRLRPNFIFFTGDLAFGELSPKDTPLEDQFRGGLKFLDEVRSAFSPVVRLEDMYLVPGNHDVQRSEATPDQTEWLERRSSLEEILRLVQYGGRQWDRFILRLAMYRQALTEHKLDHLLMDPKRLIFSRVRKVNGWRVGLAGLNSAWSSSRDAEKGRLWLGGEWQFKQLRNTLDSVDVSIALLHHPLNWLAEIEDEPRLAGIAENEFNFLLHGHEHQGWVTARAGHAKIAAAASYNRGDDNGYNIARFDPAQGTLEVFLRKYDPSGGGWVPRIIHKRTDNDGCVRTNVRIPNRSSNGATAARAAKPPRRRPRGPVKVGRDGYDAFLAIPMASVQREHYQAHFANAVRIAAALTEHCGLSRVFNPAEHIESPDDFDPPDVAIRRGLVAIARSRIFVMLYTQSAPSSVLVEAGFALAMRVPSLYFVQEGLQLPFLLASAQQAFPDVMTYEYKSTDALTRQLKAHGREICRQLLARSTQREADSEAIDWS